MNCTQLERRVFKDIEWSFIARQTIITDCEREICFLKNGNFEKDIVAFIIYLQIKNYTEINSESYYLLSSIYLS